MNLFITDFEMYKHKNFTSEGYRPKNDTFFDCGL